MERATPPSSAVDALRVGSSYDMMLIMRYPDGHKDEVRSRIVAAASKALRREGLAGVSIPALMRKVGLTHGGFYSHFANRDELVAEAVRAAGAATAEGAFGDDHDLEATLRLYLSPSHVEHPDQGCVVAALGTDAPRQSDVVRHAFGDVARGLLRLVEKKLHPAARAGTLSDDALRLAATMVGAVVLGRLVDDPKLAERILRVAKSSAPA